MLSAAPFASPPPPTRFFLDVERSLLGRSWVDRLDAEGARRAQAIEQRAGLDPLLARILAGRGVAAEDATAFLEPTVRALMPDPSTLVGMDALAARLTQAIEGRESVALFGDYDVDGACSCALLVRYFRHFGIEPQVHIPDRVFEGYGPNIAAIDALIGRGASLLITLDCGTTSDAPIAHARSRGVDVLVIDHHLSDFELPPATAIVNPNRPDDISGLGYLSAAGVAFMALVATNRALRQSGRSDLPDLLGLVDLVALSTVCDVVPLTGLNRAFVLRGLERMRRGSNPGLMALALSARLSGPATCYHLGFILGPRINAGGRIGDAALGTRLLTLESEHEALAVAARLEELNGERQRIEQEALEEALRAAEAEIGSGEGPPVLVLASAQWHPGVVGLVAARLRERFERPAFAIALMPDGSGTGSGRSLPGVDLGAAVIEAVEAGILPKGGGHAMAAGVTVRPGELGRLRAFLAERLGPAAEAARAVTTQPIDAALTARGATPEFVRELERAGPFGAGNPQPVIAFPEHAVRFAEVVGQGGHVSFSLESGDGARLRAIAFRAAGTSLGEALLGAAAADARLHMAGTLECGSYGGRERVQLRVVDAAKPSGLSLPRFPKRLFSPMIGSGREGLPRATEPSLTRQVQRLNRGRSAPTPAQSIQNSMSNSAVNQQLDSPGFRTRFLSRFIEWAGVRMIGAPRVGALTVIFPDGRSRTVGDAHTGEHAVLRLNNLAVLTEAMRRGTVGFAASYINGDIDVEDLTALFRFFLQNRDMFDAANFGLFRKAAQDLSYHLQRRNTKEGAKENISEHYDLGNEFYGQWLDPSMTYSSALFTSGDQSLEEAQRAKYHRIADLAGLKAGASVLEIGCGWGGFAETAVRDYEAHLRGITLSREQLHFATQRLVRQGLDKLAQLSFEDYRDTEGSFDHVASIEMIEAVGEENWPTYFQTVHDRLKPGGTAAIQAITINEDDFEDYKKGPDFIQRYIFPGGMLLTKTAMKEEGERAGLVLETTENFRLSYAKTLRLWRERFLERWPVISPLGYDETFKRKWVYYLCYCEAGFMEGSIDVGIYQYRRPA